MRNLNCEMSKISEIENAWIIEVKRRFDEVKSGKVEPVPGDIVMAKARAMLTASDKKIPRP